MLEVGPLARQGWNGNPYPPDYRTALAFSSVPLPAFPQRSLRKRLPPRGEMSGLPCSARTALNDLAPAFYTGSHRIRVPAYWRRATWLRTILVGACQRLWLLTLDDAYGSSHVLGVSSSLALRPP